MEVSSFTTGQLGSPIADRDGSSLGDNLQLGSWRDTNITGTKVIADFPSLVQCLKVKCGI